MKHPSALVLLVCVFAGQTFIGLGQDSGDRPERSVVPPSGTKAPDHSGMLFYYLPEGRARLESGQDLKRLYLKVLSGPLIDIPPEEVKAAWEDGYKIEIGGWGYTFYKNWLIDMRAGKGYSGKTRGFEILFKLHKVHSRRDKFGLKMETIASDLIQFESMISKDLNIDLDRIPKWDKKALGL